MVKVVVAPLRKKKGTVKTKWVRGASGKWHSVHTVDARSRALESELGYVFAKNVKRARLENKRVTGSTDLAPRKR